MMPHTLEVGIHAAQGRLEKLLAERLTSGANRGAVDKRIWNLFGETWAVMFTDQLGFSRNVADEEALE